MNIANRFFLLTLPSSLKQYAECTAENYNNQIGMKLYIIFLNFSPFF